MSALRLSCERRGLTTLDIVVVSFCAHRIKVGKTIQTGRLKLLRCHTPVLVEVDKLKDGVNDVVCLCFVLDFVLDKVRQAHGQVHPTYL